MLGAVKILRVFPHDFQYCNVYNLFQVRKANAIELLHSANHGEKEPRTRWILALLGVAALGIGYWIAIVTEDPVSTLLLFFVAVLLDFPAGYTHLA